MRLHKIVGTIRIWGLGIVCDTGNMGKYIREKTSLRTIGEINYVELLGLLERLWGIRRRYLILEMSGKWGKGIK